MITIFEMGDKKLHGQPGKFRLFFLAPIPLFLPPQGFPTAAFFPFPHAEKCHALEKDLLQNRYKHDIWVVTIFNGKGTRLFSDATEKETHSLTRAYPDLHPTDKEKQPGFFMPCRKVF